MESAKKASLQLNWDTLLPKAEDDDPPPELIVAGDKEPEPPVRVGGGGGGDISDMSDGSIEEEINRQKSNLATLRKLPDNGEKLRVRLRLLEEEIERRKLHRRIVDGSEKLTQSKKQNFTSASGDFNETTAPPREGHQSEFGALFNKKMNEKHKDRWPENGFRSTRSNTQISTRGQQKNTKPSWKSPFRCPRKPSVDADSRNERCSLNSEDVPPDSSMKRHRPLTSLASKDSNQSSENTYVLVDEEDPEPIEKTEEAGEVNECLKDSEVYYPKRNDPQSVYICSLDMECLAPQAYLSSTVMNFYIRHLQEPTSATEERSIDYHFFNTYFYNKLQEAVSKNDKESSFPKLRRWWKGVNIFQKAYILFPVHEDLHWSLVIICIPDKEDDAGLLILHLDSLDLHKSRSIIDNVKSFLIEEWKYLNEVEATADLPISDKVWKRLSRRIEGKKVQVPKQRNEYDCGLFVLYFMERFINEAPQRLKGKDLSMFGRNWFKPKEASNLRQKIKKLLKEEFRKAAAAAEDMKDESFEQPLEN